MSEKSVKPTWTSADMDKAIMRATKVLKGSAMTLTDHNVGARAASYTHATAPVITRYLQSLNPEQKKQLGFPDPNAEKPDVAKLSPDRGIVARRLSQGGGGYRRG